MTADLLQRVESAEDAMQRAGFAVGRVPRTRTGRLPASRCPKVGCPICCPDEPNH